MPSGKPPPSIRLTPRQAGGLTPPAGCKLRGPGHSWRAAPADLRYLVSSRWLQSLLIHQGPQGQGVYSARSGELVPISGFPWSKPDEPPLSDAFQSPSGAHWVTAWAHPVSDALDAIVVHSLGQAPTAVARSDQAEVVDLRCREDGCALLTSRIARASRPGASVFVGKPGSWQRRDVDSRARPRRVLGVSSDAAWVGLQATSDGGTRLEIWRVAVGQSERLGEVTTPGPLLDVGMLGDKPAVVALGADPSRPCAQPRFPLQIQLLGAEATRADAPGVPESLTLLPLDEGALLLWLVPVNCRSRDRFVLQALRLDETGRGVSGPVAVTDAVGYGAASTRDSRVQIFLSQERKLVSLQLDCSGG